MAAAVGHLGHDALIDIVGSWLWVVSYVGIFGVLYHMIGNTFPSR
jgi:hypothetical protein